MDGGLLFMPAATLWHLQERKEAEQKRPASFITFTKTSIKFLCISPDRADSSWHIS